VYTIIAQLNQFTELLINKEKMELLAEVSFTKNINMGGREEIENILKKK